jgi:cytochrome P450
MTTAAHDVPTTAGLGSLGATADSPDVFAYYGQLHERGGVVWDDEQDAWLVASYDGVDDLLRRDDDFVSGFVDRPGFSLNGLSWNEWERWNGGSRRVAPTSYDSGPHHDRLHQWWMQMSKGFRSLSKERFNPVLHSIVDRFAGRGSAELVAEYAHAATPRLAAEMLGIPYDDDLIEETLARFRLRGAFLARQGLQQTPDPDVTRQAWAAIEEIKDMFRPYVAARRSGEGGDLISTLWREAPGVIGADVTDEDILSAIITWWNSGSATVVHATINGLYLAVKDPEWRDAAARDVEVLRRVIEESLRLYGPSHWVPRYARHDTTLGGAPISGGDKLLIMLHAANLDPGHYERPLEARLDRPNPRDHFSFSKGKRRSGGAALARTELEEMLSVLLERLPDIRLAPDAEPPTYRGLVIRAWMPLHVAFTPA